MLHLSNDHGTPMEQQEMCEKYLKKCVQKCFQKTFCRCSARDIDVEMSLANQDLNSERWFERGWGTGRVHTNDQNEDEAG